MSEPIEEHDTPTPADVARATAAHAEDKATDELPDWARKQISDANAEAAKFRVQYREADKVRKILEEQVTALSTEHVTASQSLSGVQEELDKLVTAIKAEVPHQHVFAFAKTLKGANEEELQAHAAELKSMFSINASPARAIDRLQGLGTATGKADPATEFASILQGVLKQ